MLAGWNGHYQAGQSTLQETSKRCNNELPQKLANQNKLPYLLYWRPLLSSILPQLRWPDLVCRGYGVLSLPTYTKKKTEQLSRNHNWRQNKGRILSHRFRVQDSQLSRGCVRKRCQSGIEPSKVAGHCQVEQLPCNRWNRDRQFMVILTKTKGTTAYLVERNPCCQQGLCSGILRFSSHVDGKYPLLGKNVCVGNACRNIESPRWWLTLLTALTSAPLFNTAAAASTQPRLQRTWRRDSPYMHTYYSRKYISDWHSTERRWLRSYRFWMKDRQHCGGRGRKKGVHGGVESRQVPGSSQVA